MDMILILIEEWNDTDTDRRMDTDMLPVHPPIPDFRIQSQEDSSEYSLLNTA